MLEVKRRWIADGEGRQKDINDVNLMEQYLSKLGNGWQQEFLAYVLLIFIKFLAKLFYELLQYYFKTS